MFTRLLKEKEKEIEDLQRKHEVEVSFISEDCACLSDYALLRVRFPSFAISLSIAMSRTLKHVSQCMNGSNRCCCDRLTSCQRSSHGQQQNRISASDLFAGFSPSSVCGFLVLTFCMSVCSCISASCHSFWCRLLDELRGLRKLQRDTQRAVEQKFRDLKRG